MPKIFKLISLKRPWKHSSSHHRSLSEHKEIHAFPKLFSAKKETHSCRIWIRGINPITYVDNRYIVFSST